MAKDFVISPFEPVKIDVAQVRRVNVDLAAVWWSSSHGTCHLFRKNNCIRKGHEKLTSDHERAKRLILSSALNDI